MVTIDNDDMYSLLKWCEEREMEAHKKFHEANALSDTHGKGVFYGEMLAYKAVADKIRNGRISQRPHFDGM